MIRTTQKLPLTLLLIVLGLSACEKDNSSSNSDSDYDSEDRQSVLDEYNDYFLSTETAKGYGWSDGDIESCTPGTLSSDAKNQALIRINYFRRCVGLNDDISFDSEKNDKCQQAALMQDANNSLNHYPPESWSCYTSDGYEASSSSNLAMGYSVSGAIAGYMNDNSSGNTAVGHRRWILYSKAQTMGIGHTTNYNALWVIGGSNSSLPEDMPDFIPWPPQGYVPAPLVFSRWSFSIPSADFSDASVEMTDNSGNSVSLSIVSSTDNGYGDNTIVWEPSDIDKSSEDDVSYQVSVKNVTVNSESADYSYSVTIIQP